MNVRSAVGCLCLSLLCFPCGAETAYPLYIADCAEGTCERPARLDEMKVEIVLDRNAQVMKADIASLKPTSGTFVKRGRGWLMSSVAMTNFTGTIIVREGALMTERPGMTGPADAKAGEIVVSDGATFAIAPKKGTCANYKMGVFNRIRLSGRGVGGVGALYNAAEGVNVRDTFCGQIVLDADATTGGAGTADFGDRGGAAKPYALNGHTLTFGAGGSWVMNGAKVESGRIEIAKGARLQVQSGWTLFGDGTLAVKDGGTLVAYNGGKWNAPWKMTLEGGAALGPSGSNPADRDRLDRHNWSGPVDIRGDVAVNGTQAFTFHGPVTGPGVFRIARGWIRAVSPESALTLVLVPAADGGGLLGGERGLAAGDVFGAEKVPYRDLTVKGRWTLHADELETKVLETEGKLVFAPGAEFVLDGIGDVVEAPGRIVVARSQAGGLVAPKFDGGGSWRLETSADGRELALVRADGRAAAKREKPLFRVGWISDTHTGPTRASFGLVEKAMKLFREQNVDAVINNGDISDHYYPTGYPIYRQVMDESFAGLAKRPLEIYAWAWHDVYEWNGPRVRESNEAQRKACYADVAKRLGIRHGMADRFDVNGFIFIVFPQWTNDAEWHGKKGWEAYELILQEAERDCGGKPIFVVDHVPPSATVANSITWGDAGKRGFYAKHPGIISLSGHTHGSLRDENQIWQGEFTAVNAACLQVWEGDSAGISEPSKRSYGAIVIEGFKDRIVFRRFDVRDGMEYRKWNPWIVPWPFDPKTAPYSFERRAKTTPVPAFAADAKVVARADEPFTGFTLALPPVASGADLAYRYRVSVAERTADGWRGFKTVEKYTQFYLRPSERQREVQLPLSAGYFTGGRRYRFEVAPVNFFGVAGKPVFGEATAPEVKPAKVLWKSENPMEELAFVYGDDGTDGGKPVAKRDGWYEDTGAMARLVVPEKAWKAPTGTKLRFTVDLETVQAEDLAARTYNVSLMRFKPSLESACGRIKTLHGASGVQRYVVEFTKGKDVPFHFIVREGLAGKVKFHAVKVESL